MFGERGEWMAGVLRLADGSTARFAGNVTGAVGESVLLTGEWCEDAKWGRQFKAAGMIVDLALDPDALRNYLAKNPRFENIGPVRADALVTLFFDTWETSICDEPERVAAVSGISPDVIANLSVAWRETRDVNSTYVALAGYGLTYLQTKRLVEKLGGNAVAVIERDPYRLVELVPTLGFKRIDDVVVKMGLMAEADPRRLRAGTLHVMRRMLARDGHTWAEATDLVREVSTYLTFNELESEDALERLVGEMIVSGELGHVVDGELACVTLPGVLFAEAAITTAITAAAALPGALCPDAADLLFGQVRADLGREPNESQEAAALTAFTSRVSVICGPAGTGKTTTIEAIRALGHAAGLSVALAALSGKAAKRISELLGDDAMTVHRLLEYNQRGFGRNRMNPVTADLVVVDEASMMDVHLGEALFNAIDFGRTSLVLVGDPYQLPPVGPGAVFRDIIASKRVPVTRLTQVQRHAGYLAEACTAILRGEILATCPAVPGHLPAWSNVTRLVEPDDVIAQVVRIFEEKLPAYGIDPFDGVQVLTAWNKGPLGTNALNVRLQAFLQKSVFNVNVARSTSTRPTFYPGDRVIQTRNDYDAGIMNGELGRVASVDEKHVVVQFEGTPNPTKIALGSEELDNLDLAYALTIHKFQGSQVPVAIAIVHRAHMISLNRELLYTAATRAQKAVVLLGDGWGARHAASRPTAHRRRTLLGNPGVVDVAPAGTRAAGSTKGAA